MIAPKIPLVQDGQILSTNLVNSMIGRIEYAADLLRQYKLIAGDEMYVEPHFDGTRVSYFYPTKGGATPIGASITIPTNKQFPFQNNLFTLIGKDGTSGKVLNAADQKRLFGDPSKPFIIDVSDFTRIFGSSARLRAKGTVGEFLPMATGIFGGLDYASWVFGPGAAGTYTSLVPINPPPASGASSQLTIRVFIEFASLSFETFYI